jgi:hypothetical protein
VGSSEASLQAHPVARAVKVTNNQAVALSKVERAIHQVGQSKRKAVNKMHQTISQQTVNKVAPQAQIRPSKHNWKLTMKTNHKVMK